jgi:hypothetical protein
VLYHDGPVNDNGSHVNVSSKTILAVATKPHGLLGERQIQTYLLPALSAHWSLHIFTFPRSGRVGRGSGRGGLRVFALHPLNSMYRRPSPGLRARLSRKRESELYLLFLDESSTPRCVETNAPLSGRFAFLSSQFSTPRNLADSMSLCIL